MFTQKGTSGISGILEYDTFYGFFKEDGKDQLVEGGRYRPATLISFALENSLFGNNPHISHALNALLYGAMCAIIYLLCFLFAQTKFTRDKALQIALIIALIFACHPVHTEVVANIKGRDEIFVGLFGLLSMLMLFQKDKKWWHYLIAFLSILIAYFSKEHAIIFAIIIPLSIWIFGEKEQARNLWLSCIGIILLAGFYLFVRANILGTSIENNTTELMNNPFLKFDGKRMIDYSFQEKWSTIIYNLGRYLQLAVFPYPLTSDYYPYHIPAKSFTNIWVLLSLITHIGLVIAAIWGFFKRKIWTFGIIFYFGFLFLLSNILLNIGTNISERFLFIPSLGLIFSIVVGLYSYLGESPEMRRKTILSYLKFPLIAFLLLGSFYTISRSQVWKNDFSLLTTDVLYSTNSAKALHGAAGALSTESVHETNEQKRKEMIQLSNEYLDKTIAIYPLYSNAYLIKGNNYYYLKEYEKAIASYEQLLRMSPENDNAMKNLAIALRDAGRYYGEIKNDLSKSINYIQRSYELRPNDYETLRLLGISNGMAGNHSEAIRFFQAAKNLSPTDAYAWLNLGNAFYRMGNKTEGANHHRKAVELDPSLANRANVEGN